MILFRIRSVKRVKFSCLKPEKILDQIQEILIKRISCIDRPVLPTLFEIRSTSVPRTFKNTIYVCTGLP